MTPQSPNLAELAKFYDERYKHSYMESLPKPWVRQVEDTLAEISTPVEDLLDYGCGQGTWTPVLAKRFPDARLCGVDISEQAIIKARQKFPDCDFRVFDGSFAPFESESFDMIFSFHVLEHVADLKITVADLSRLARKNGCIAAILPCGNEGSFEERLVRQIEDGREVSVDRSGRFFYEDPSHLRRLRTNELVRLFAENDVLLCSAFYANQFWGTLAWITRMGSGFVRELCDYQRGRTRGARIRLRVLRLLLIPLALAMQVHTTARMSRIVTRRTKLPKRLILLSVIPLKIIIYPFAKIIEWLSFLEWRFRRMRPNGSAQYLIFRKGGS
jgi:trans-aconitate methyltransferase